MTILRKAVAANPDYAESYYQLAALLPPGPEADEAARQGRLRRAQQRPVYTENLIGPVFEAGKAHAEVAVRIGNAGQWGRQVSRNGNGERGRRRKPTEPERYAELASCE